MKQIPTYGKIKEYYAGLILSVICTLLAYFIVAHHWFIKPVEYALAGLFGVGQAVAQLIFFLHLGKESKPRWNFLMFNCMASIVVIIVLGTIWIMYHLNYNMMEM